MDDEHLDNVLGDISAVDEQGRFASLPTQIVEGLLGKEGSFRVADIGVPTEDAYASVYTESFVSGPLRALQKPFKVTSFHLFLSLFHFFLYLHRRDGASLQYFDAEFTPLALCRSSALARRRYANLLSPHLARARIEVTTRSSALLHEV